MLVIGMITDLIPLPLSLEEDHQVVVPDTSVPLSDKQMAFLENHYNPLQGNGRSGENAYLSCLRILCSLIHRMYVSTELTLVAKLYLVLKKKSP